MSKIKGITLLGIACIIAMIFSAGIGTVYITPIDCLNIVIERITGMTPFGEVNDTQSAILMDIRIPRAFLAFISGAGLSVSGVIMQSVLKNPLASSYTIGVSSGAALGASAAIFLKISIFGIFTLPLFGLTGGLITVFLAIGIARQMDKGLNNNTIILTGMALSLFANSAITIMTSLARDSLEAIVFWQMGSFASRDPIYPMILFPIVLIVIFACTALSRQMDVMSLGDEQANVSGVNVKRMKSLLMVLASLLTGVIVSMVGVIGFIDLFAPHATRRLFGATHRYVIPASALVGGFFMLVCDLASRMLIAPIQLPVGAITSVLGAPFFIYLYFSGRNKSSR